MTYDERGGGGAGEAHWQKKTTPNGVWGNRNPSAIVSSMTKLMPKASHRAGPHHRAPYAALHGEFDKLIVTR